MSVPQENRRGTLLEWVKDSGLLTITILGLLLYTLFAIPTTIFYRILGASLAEVGITYTGLLSGSTLSLMLIVLAIVYFVTVPYIIYRLALGARTGVSIPRNLQTIRERGSTIGAWVKHHPISLGMGYLVVLAVMSSFAVISAIDVKNGQSAGNVADVLGYRANPVTVCPASKVDEQMYKWLAEEKAYLLGETAQDVVLYLPHTAETIQVPIAAVIISTFTSSTGHCRGG
jgi:hypothetical protein